MKLKRFNFTLISSSKAQSFVELTLIFSILLILMAGMVEFGNLLNQYINLVDGAREGARFASNNDPFGTLQDGSSSYEIFFAKAYQIIEGCLSCSPPTKGAINPMSLSKANGDDIVVTFYSVTAHDPITGALKATQFASGAGSKYGNHTSNFNSAKIQALLDPTAPNTGVVVVEIFYAYNQILKLFAFTGIPDPINVHAYSIMPLSAAEPTATPRP